MAAELNLPPDDAFLHGLNFFISCFHSQFQTVRDRQEGIANRIDSACNVVEGHSADTHRIFEDLREMGGDSHNSQIYTKKLCLWGFGLMVMVSVLFLLTAGLLVASQSLLHTALTDQQTLLSAANDIRQSQLLYMRRGYLGDCQRDLQERFKAIQDDLQNGRTPELEARQEQISKEWNELQHAWKELRLQEERDFRYFDGVPVRNPIPSRGDGTNEFSLR